MVRTVASLLLRWLINSLGIYVSVLILGRFEHLSGDSATTSAWVILLAGLVFSVVNSLLRPIAIIVSLPAIVLTLGLFTFIVNGFIVWLSLALVPGIQLSFWNSVLAGIILGIINYVISSLIEFRAGAIEKRHGY